MQGFKSPGSAQRFLSTQRSDLQHLQRPAPSLDKADTQSPPVCGDEHVAQCNRRRLICASSRPLARFIRQRVKARGGNQSCSKARVCSVISNWTDGLSYVGQLSPGLSHDHLGDVIDSKADEIATAKLAVDC
jgi:hypothetical protein